jgi:hypothetical protein
MKYDINLNYCTLNEVKIHKQTPIVDLKLSIISQGKTVSNSLSRRGKEREKDG